MAANWFQEEAVVRHGQSDVRNRPGRAVRNLRLLSGEIRKNGSKKKKILVIRKETIQQSYKL